MQISITAEQKHIFSKQGWIELQEALRLKALPSFVSKKDPSNMWRPSRQFAEGASLLLKRELPSSLKQLLGVKRLYLGYDLLLKDPSVFQEISFQKISSLQPIAGGIFLRLNSTDSPLLKEGGDILCVGGSKVPPWKELIINAESPLLLIFYCERPPQYIVQKTDPFSREWKRLGFAFGDRVETKELCYKD